MRESEDKAYNAQMDKGTQIVTIFRPYQFQPSHKIHIDGGQGPAICSLMPILRMTPVFLKPFCALAVL